MPSTSLPVGERLDSSWQGCPDPRLKLQTGTGRHGGGAEPLNAVWENNKNIWHNRGLREPELYAGAQLSTRIWACLWDSILQCL